jgi:hypothetical protein
MRIEQNPATLDNPETEATVLCSFRAFKTLLYTANNVPLAILSAKNRIRAAGLISLKMQTVCGKGKNAAPQST